MLIVRRQTPKIMTQRTTSSRSIVTLITFLLVTIPCICGIASEESVPAGHALAVTIPDGWERRTGLTGPILIAAVERGTGNSFALLGFKQPDDKYILNRKSAETGILNELGPSGKILRRLDTKLAGLSAYCVIGETEIQGRKISMARIMTEKPLNGFIYAVQYSKIGGGDFDDAFIKAIAGRVRMKQEK
jgi:hypothetical protein